MAIKRINIEQEFAKIGVRTTPAKLRINKPRAQITIENVRPELDVDTQNASFTVNKRKQNSESGLKAPLELAQAFRNEGRKVAIQAVGQAKDDGNFLANHKIEGDKVPMLAERKAEARLGTKDFNIGLMPQTPPEITWDKGFVRFNWSNHSVVVDFSGEYMPDMSVDPKYSVEVFLRQEPYFRVMVEEAVSSSSKYVNSSV